MEEEPEPKRPLDLRPEGGGRVEVCNRRQLQRANGRPSRETWFDAGRNWLGLQGRPSDPLLRGGARKAFVQGIFEEVIVE